MDESSFPGADARGIQRSSVISRDRLRATNAAARPVVLASTNARTGPPFTITPILAEAHVAGLDIRCPCGRHGYVELVPQSDPTPPTAPRSGVPS